MNTTRNKKERDQEPWLFFIDTNILLNFHSGGGRVTKFIEYVKEYSQYLITSEHVKMEYMKNRQKKILTTYNNLKPALPTCPPVVVDKKVRKTFNDAKNQFNGALEEMQHHVQEILDNPDINDPINRALLSVWETQYPFNLQRADKSRFEIRRLAQKRHMLGYPPNCKTTVYLADALHWEWIIHGASLEDTYNVIIVSNDSDFGEKHGNKRIVNDWLKEEFEKRVGNKRTVELTNELSHAIRKFNSDKADELDGLEDETLHPHAPIEFEPDSGAPNVGE